jgi:type IV fimbrial biogenesis protein FimT
MFPVSGSGRATPQRGFTLLELMVGVTIIGILMAIGIPSLVGWSAANKVAGASEFYMEGFRLARQQAVMHNAASRIRFTPNPTNGQPDWQVDLCFPTAIVPCNDVSGAWSEPGLAAGGDPEGAAGFTSVSRFGSTLPGSAVVTIGLLPEGNSVIYYTPLGWVDTNFPNRLERIALTPDPSLSSHVRTAAVVVTLAGLPAKCDPTLPIADSRACPP